MDITYIHSEHREGFYFGEDLFYSAKSDWPASETLESILRKVITEGLTITGYHVYYLDEIPEDWYGEFPKDLTTAKAAFMVDEKVEEKILELAKQSGLPLKLDRPVIKVYNETHIPQP